MIKIELSIMSSTQVTVKQQRAIITIIIINQVHHIKTQTGNSINLRAPISITKAAVAVTTTIIIIIIIKRHQRLVTAKNH
jgi:hypothetical protein